jgi:Zn-finger nucleic acid-binding protein
VGWIEEALMTPGHVPPSGIDCPLCSGRLETWVRARLQVDFCDGCSALFLDRGELFQMFREEGYQCPPEALLRHGFTPTAGELLSCPKCRTSTLRPGTVEGAEMWYCTPCNGFLVDRSLLLGERCAESVPLDLLGFRLSGTQIRGDGLASDPNVGGYIARVLQRLVFRTKGAR